MKKLSTVLLALTLSALSYGATPAPAVDHTFIWGVQAGLNFSKTSTLQVGGNRTGFLLGLMVEAPWFASLSIQPELNYVQRGNNGQGPAGAVNPLAASADYLEIPMQVKFSLGELAGFKPFILAGPYFAFLLAAHANDQSVKSSFASLETGADFGVGASHQLNPKISLFFRARYALGFNSSVADQRNSSVDLLVGLQF